MESRDDFRSILPYLPLIIRSSAIFWPPAVLEALQSLSKGPSHSNVNSGQLFALAVADLRNSLGEYPLHPSASLGFSVFFDDLMDKDEAGRWFGEVVPRLAGLLLRLPELLETHYQNTGALCGMGTGLRLLRSQHPGIVLLSQELIAALLVCALFCLFPTTDRGTEHLPRINFNRLFECLYECNFAKQEHKIKCLVQYFDKISSDMPSGNVSFERKVIPFKNNLAHIAYPEPDFWSKSTVSLCQFKVQSSGLIEDRSVEALGVDFANKYIGGGALGRGCVQEEICFMIYPELIVSMFFMPKMAENEAIEIVGAQRFSNYRGYAKTFRFSGGHEDKKSVDAMGRRKKRTIAIDSLSNPGWRQYRLDGILRETNKAFCGFMYQQKHQLYKKLFEGNRMLDLLKHSSASSESSHPVPQNIDEIGVVTGNWGCGAFGGDPEIKAVVQWMAASQALRPFIMYCTFHLEALEKLELVVEWILEQGWSVGELWNILVEYSTQKLNGECRVGFFKWLLPYLYEDDPMAVDG